MAKFPELPKLPDPAEPLRTLAQGIKDLGEGAKTFDQAKDEALKALRESREHFEETLKNPPKL